MTPLQARLRRVEEALPEPRQPSKIVELLPYLVGYELSRLGGILERAIIHGAGWPVGKDKADYERLLTTALQRQLAGWQLDRITPQMEALQKEDAAKGWAIWQLIFALRARHPGEYFTALNDADYCDLLDVDVAEITELTKLIRLPCTDADALRLHAGVISRLRLGGRPTSLEEFGRLIFHGELPKATYDQPA